MKISDDAALVIKTNMLKILLYILFLLIILVISYETAYPQCVREITPADSWQIAYRERKGDKRCEGFYRSEVAGRGGIEVVGLVKGRFAFEPDKKEVIEVSSPFVKNKPIYVCALGIPIKTYYRMDAKIDPGQKLRWPAADVICPQNLDARIIGIFGWIGTGAKKTYIPVSTRAKMKPAVKDDKIRLYLRPSNDVEGVKWRFCDVFNDSCSDFGKWKKPRKSYYRAGQPICILLPSGKTEELCVKVSAKEKYSAACLEQTFRVIVREKG
jgi:hypothetical protein